MSCPTTSTVGRSNWEVRQSGHCPLNERQRLPTSGEDWEPQRVYTAGAVGRFTRWPRRAGDKAGPPRLVCQHPRSVNNPHPRYRTGRTFSFSSPHDECDPKSRYPHRSFDARANRVVMSRLIGTYTKELEVMVMMTLRDQLNDCLYLLARARLAGNDDAIRRYSEHRAVLVKQIAGMRTHLRLV